MSNKKRIKSGFIFSVWWIASYDEEFHQMLSCALRGGYAENEKEDNVELVFELMQLGVREGYKKRKQLTN